MDPNTIYLTGEGYEKLKKELKHLKSVRLKELSKEIGEAIEHGDLSENAEYDAAKEAQEMCMKRINKLEKNLVRVRVIDDMDIPSDKAYIGATVTVEDLDSGKESKITLVSGLEADAENGKISIKAPVGKNLLGHKIGDTVEIEIPAGKIKYKITDITR